MNGVNQMNSTETFISGDGFAVEGDGYAIEGYGSFIEGWND